MYVRIGFFGGIQLNNLSVLFYKNLSDEKICVIIAFLNPYGGIIRKNRWHIQEQLWQFQENDGGTFRKTRPCNAYGGSFRRS